MWHGKSSVESGWRNDQSIVSGDIGRSYLVVRASTVGTGDLHRSYGLNCDCGCAWQRLRFLSGLKRRHVFFRLFLFLIAVAFNSPVSAEERFLISDAIPTQALTASVTTGDAEEHLDVDDYQLTEVCSETVQKYQPETFQLETKPYLPKISLRNAEAALDIQDVSLGAGFDGLLFKRGNRAVLHCFNQFYWPNFILLERSERWLIFESGGRQATDAHIHSYISNCG